MQLFVKWPASCFVLAHVSVTKREDKSIVLCAHPMLRILSQFTSISREEAPVNVILTLLCWYSGWSAE
jgi:hypothetical protein